MASPRKAPPGPCSPSATSAISPNARIVDVLGKCDRVIARLPARPLLGGEGVRAYIPGHTKLDYAWSLRPREAGPGPIQPFEPWRGSTLPAEGLCAGVRDGWPRLVLLPQGQGGGLAPSGGSPSRVGGARLDGFLMDFAEGTLSLGPVVELRWQDGRVQRPGARLPARPLPLRGHLQDPAHEAGSLHVPGLERRPGLRSGVAYALQLVFSDGHKHGAYSYDLLLTFPDEA